MHFAPREWGLISHRVSGCILFLIKELLWHFLCFQIRLTHLVNVHALNISNILFSTAFVRLSFYFTTVCFWVSPSLFFKLGDFRFNRASLFNVGFRESDRVAHFDCFIFHDVDLLPEDDRLPYRCGKQPIHLSVSVDTHNYK